MHRWIRVRAQLCCIAGLPLVGSAGGALAAMTTDPGSGLLALAAIVAVLLGAASVGLAMSLSRRLRAASYLSVEVANRALPIAVERAMDGGARPPRTIAVDIEGSDELADLAIAFNSVQDIAVDLAVAYRRLQTNMKSLLTAAKRNRRMTDQIVRSVDELAASVDDASPALRRLDQLALQLVRGSDSLLVLANEEALHTGGTQATMSELMHQTMDEVDGAERIRLVDVEAITVNPAATGSLVHLLAELVDNALRFSSHDATVTVKGQVTRGGYHIAVVDSGIGMSPVFIEQVNRQLSSGGGDEPPPDGSLGHAVVARLARQLDTRVRLVANPDGVGVTANVLLPSPLISGQRARTLNDALGQADSYGASDHDLVEATETPNRQENHR